MCRAFPTVLEIALSLSSRRQLTELTFDVDISSDAWSFNSDSFFKKFLSNDTVEQIPTMQFHVLRGRHSREAVIRHARQFAAFMREKGFISREVIYSAEEVRELLLLAGSLRQTHFKFTEVILLQCL
jgi:hypothetical protein